MRHRGFIGRVGTWVCVCERVCVAQFSMLTICRVDLKVIFLSVICGRMCAHGDTFGRANVLVCLWAWGLQPVIVHWVAHVFVCACARSPGALVPHLPTCLKQTGILTHGRGMWPLNNWNGCLRLDRAGWPPLILTQRRMWESITWVHKWRPVHKNPSVPSGYR